MSEYVNKFLFKCKCLNLSDLLNRFIEIFPCIIKRYIDCIKKNYWNIVNFYETCNFLPQPLLLMDRWFYNKRQRLLIQLRNLWLKPEKVNKIFIFCIILTQRCLVTKPKWFFLITKNIVYRTTHFLRWNVERYCTKIDFSIWVNTW